MASIHHDDRRQCGRGLGSTTAGRPGPFADGWATCCPPRSVTASRRSSRRARRPNLEAA